METRIESRSPIEQTRPRYAPRHPMARNMVSNGKKLLSIEGLDGRSSLSRRFRDLIEAITNDLGGPEQLSEGQRQLIRRVATLAITAEAMEGDCIRGLPFNADTYGSLTDRMRRALQRLGLSRLARDVDKEARGLDVILGRVNAEDGEG